jgi:NTE family protein
MPPTESSTKSIALVLAGGVAKGAFEAGALDVLTTAPVRIKRIVAASSGALNATLLGASIRQGDARAGAARLAELWSQRASWTEFFDFSIGDLIAGRAVSSANRVMGLLREQVHALLTTGKNPISLRFVTAAIEGSEGRIDGRPATTFETILSFEGEDYDTDPARECLFNGALASSAFPALFPPREVTIAGRTIHGVDGGVVANTPIKTAIGDVAGGDDAIGCVVLIAPYPELIDKPPALKGLSLATEILEMLVEERLYRDLRDATEVNRTAALVDGLKSHGFTDEQVAIVRKLALKGKRYVPIVSVRPKEVLEGTPFSGFFDKKIRDRYIAAGHECAQAALGDICG